MNRCIDEQDSDREQQLHRYLDSDLDLAEQARFESHLESCAACREQADGLLALRGALQERLPCPAAPASLRQKVLASLDEVDRQLASDAPAAASPAAPRPSLLSRWLDWLMPAGATAAAAFAALLFWQSQASVSGPAPASLGATSAPVSAASPVGLNLAEDAVRSHERNLPMEVRPVSTGGEEIDRFFAGRVPVRVKVPQLPAACNDCALLGGRLTQLDGRDAAQLFYRVGDSPLTVHIFDPRGQASLLEGAERVSAGGRDMYLQTARGYHVVLVEEGGVGYAFTSDLPQKRLVELAAASVRF